MSCLRMMASSAPATFARNGFVDLALFLSSALLMSLKRRSGFEISESQVFQLASDLASCPKGAPSVRKYPSSRARSAPVFLPARRVANVRMLCRRSASFQSPGMTRNIVHHGQQASCGSFSAWALLPRFGSPALPDLGESFTRCANFQGPNWLLMDADIRASVSSQPTSCSNPVEMQVTSSFMSASVCGHGQGMGKIRLAGKRATCHAMGSARKIHKRGGAGSRSSLGPRELGPCVTAS